MKLFIEKNTLLNEGDKMSTQITKNSFEKFYDDTYLKTLGYLMCKCKDLDDVNDIIQEIYTDLYAKVYKNQYIQVENIEAYIIGIASKKVKRHYSFKISKKDKVFSIEEVESFADMSVDLDERIINENNKKAIWEFLKNKKGVTPRVFYLFYVLEVPIKEIARNLNISESCVKNHLYRTQKELKEYYFQKEGEKCLMKKQKKLC